MKTPIITASLLATAAAFAETWSFDPAVPENNTKSSLIIAEGVEYAIDAEGGDLSTTGTLQNKGILTITTGSNSLSIGTSGGFFQNHGTACIGDATLKNASIFNENAGSTMTFTGNADIQVDFTTKNGASAIFKYGSHYTSSKTVTIGNGGTMIFDNAGADTINTNWAFQTEANSKIQFNLGNNSLQCTGTSAMIAPNFTKAMNGQIAIDLAQFVPSDEFIIGEIYTITLLNDKSGQNQCTNWDDVINASEFITNGEYAEFVENSAKYDESAHLLTIDIKAIPEPAECAAAFALLAAFAAAWRRKNQGGFWKN